MLNTKEHLLVCLNEECTEIAQAVDKALRFGLDDIRPGGHETNMQQICRELSDLLGVVELLNEIEPGIRPVIERDAVEAKKNKVRHYMNYAKERGTLSTIE